MIISNIVGGLVLCVLALPMMRRNALVGIGFLLGGISVLALGISPSLGNHWSGYALFFLSFAVIAVGAVLGARRAVDRARRQRQTEAERLAMRLKQE